MMYEEERLTLPAYITVCTGRIESFCQTVEIPLLDYIKNIASVNLDPALPTEALRAGVYALSSRAFNRIYDRTYRKKGYPFDVTSDPAEDSRYIHGHGVFSTINDTVNEIFADYIADSKTGAPFFADICYDGNRCRGMSMEDAAVMALNGDDSGMILRYSYGDDTFVNSASVMGFDNSILTEYPLYPSDTGSGVSGLQITLNTISANYGGIPYISLANGFYGQETEAAVRGFQRIFDLTPDGIFTESTYYNMLYVFESIKKLSVLVEQGDLEGIGRDFIANLRYGNVGNKIKLLQYYLNFISAFYEGMPSVDAVGVFGEKTFRGVTAFQRMFGFVPDGVVSRQVWDKLISVYESLYNMLPDSVFGERTRGYGGNILVLGSVGDDVVYLQKYINKVAEYYNKIPQLPTNGVFDRQTEDAVKILQRTFGIKDSGVVTSTTWNILSRVYNAISAGE